MYKIYTMRI